MEGLKQMLFLSVLRKREKGVTTVEYAIMLVLVGLAVLMAAPNVRKAVTDVFDALVTNLKVPAGT